MSLFATDAGSVVDYVRDMLVRDMLLIGNCRLTDESFMRKAGIVTFMSRARGIESHV